MLSDSQINIAKNCNIVKILKSFLKSARSKRVGGFNNLRTRPTPGHWRRLDGKCADDMTSSVTCHGEWRGRGSRWRLLSMSVMDTVSRQLSLLRLQKKPQREMHSPVFCSTCDFCSSRPLVEGHSTEHEEHKRKREKEGENA